MTLVELNEALKEGFSCVYLTAKWCGPCRTLSPIMSQFGEMYNVVKIDVDESPEIPVAYGIRSVPNLLFVKDGVVKEQVVGVRSVSDLNRVFKKHS